MFISLNTEKENICGIDTEKKLTCRKWAKVCGQLENHFSLYIFCAAHFFFLMYWAGISFIIFLAKRDITLYVYQLGVRLKSMRLGA